MTNLIEIFARCTTCGRDGAKIARIQNWADKNKIMIAVHKTGTRRTIAANVIHMDYQEKAGMDIDSFIPIIVEDDKKITRLDKWTLPV